MNYKLILFDLDGTLVDSLSDITNSVNYVAEMYSLEEYSKDTVKKFIGNGIRKLVERCLSEYGKSIEDGLPKFREYYEKDLLDETSVYEGIADVLEILNEKEIINVVLTNKPQRYAKKNEPCYDSRQESARGFINRERYRLRG